MLCLVFSSITAFSQKGLNIENAFQKYGHSKGCKMVELHNTLLNGYKLKLYKSLEYKDKQINIETYLKADRKNAVKIREVVQDGQTTSGYYMMQQASNGINRYILFNYKSNRKGTLIYIEGALSPDDIIQLCFTKKKH